VIVEERQTAPGRSCGSCSLCCKLLRVLELDKPANEWCGHCKPGHGGCAIYDSRPQICRGYYCGWMLSDRVGDEWYPLTCHMILSIGRIDGVQMVTVTVDGRYPLTWREPKYHQQLVRMARGGLKVDDPEKVYIVQVRVDNRVWLVLPDRDVEITRCSYILKLASPGEWEVEMFDTQEQAATRVAVLARY
jgi:hypothetical protein